MNKIYVSAIILELPGGAYCRFCDYISYMGDNLFPLPLESIMKMQSIEWSW